MFILYPLLVAIVIGLVTGGRLSRLASLKVRLWWLALAGLVIQVVLFSPAFADIGAVGPVVYVASSLAVLAAVVANLNLPGAVLVLLGGVANQVAIISNGGYMPTTAEALEMAGLAPTVGYSNSRELAAPAFGWLTDIYALPAWVPFANVFSLGDVLIGLGIAWLALRTMHADPSDAAKGSPEVLPAERSISTEVG
jgi:hypothetical protein